LEYDKDPSKSSNTGIGAIPVTGGNSFDIGCTNPSSYNLASEGIFVSFSNLCNYQSVIDGQPATGLPGNLPDGASFIQGISVNVLKDGAFVNPLPNDASITIEFPVPAGQENSPFLAVVWNGSKWVEVTGQKSADGFFTITSNLPGTFLMISK
jgi:hypothetical protein